MYKILVVDDEEDVLDLAATVLETEGYKVYTAVDGEEALNLITLHKPDLVLLDIVLPNMSGLDVCRNIKRDPATKKLRYSCLLPSGLKRT